MSDSKIFRRNRALGYVSNEIPSIVRFVQRRKDNLIVTCIGRSFQVYTASHFRLLTVSGVHPDEITCLAADRYCIYAASDKCIYAWRAGREIKHKFVGHESNVHLMLPFRDHLISVDGMNLLKIWDVKSGDVFMEIPFEKDEFRITAIMHPPAYLNKMLLGSEHGRLQLWNVKDSKLIHSFQGKYSRVTVLEPAPALNVVAIGYHNGSIVLHNLKYDETVMEFKQDWGMVTGVSFRTDQHSIMASSSNNGNVVFWDLDERRIVSQINAHRDSVTTTNCFPNEPLLFTSSSDNSMKLWIFDMPDGAARLLRTREGHSAPPLCIRYHGAGGEIILSSGEDSSLRIFSTLSETLNKSLGRASYNRKASKKKNLQQKDPLIMPPVTYFTTETTREKEWDNVVAIHSGLALATTWSLHKCKMGDLKLVTQKFHNKNIKNLNTEATSICSTHCGNFVIIGYSSGDVERFNIQSGIHRAKYGDPAHDRAAVRGIACDTLNQIVITGCSNGHVKFWNFREETAKSTIAHLKMENGVTMFRSHQESAMLCIALDDFSLSILDYDTRNIVRTFKGHSASITDATFSPDSRWLITAAMDSTIKIWDIPSSYMIDHFMVEHPCISLSMSPSGDFLATAHVNYLGLFLWANKGIFSHLSLRSIDPFSKAPYIDLPSNFRDSDKEIRNLEITEDGEDLKFSYCSPEQLEEDLITMSSLTGSRWQNLLDLDFIKERNKPLMPIKIPKQAPFFLPTVAGTEIKFDLPNSVPTGINSKILLPKNFIILSTLGKILNNANSNQSDNTYHSGYDHLKKLGPSMIDFEIKSLHPIAGGSYKVMLEFLKMIVCMFRTNGNFELAQSYLACFLKVHGRALTELKELNDCLKEVENAQADSWCRLEQKLLYGLGVVSALRNYAC